MRLIPQSQAELAPDWEISTWVNHDPIALAELRGRVVVLHAFQMLCPGCVHEPSLADLNPRSTTLRWTARS